MLPLERVSNEIAEPRYLNPNGLLRELYVRDFIAAHPLAVDTSFDAASCQMDVQVRPLFCVNCDVAEFEDYNCSAITSLLARQSGFSYQHSNLIMS